MKIFSGVFTHGFDSLINPDVDLLGRDNLFYIHTSRRYENAISGGNAIPLYL